MVTLADIAGAATQPLTTINKRARSVYFRVVSGAGVCRVGDSATAVGRGLPVTLTQPLNLQYEGDDFNYSTNGLYVYVPAGTILAVAYEPFGG